MLRGLYTGKILAPNLTSHAIIALLSRTYLIHILPHVQVEQGCTSTVSDSLCLNLKKCVLPTKFFIKFVPISPLSGSTHSKCCSVLSKFKFSTEFQSELWIKFEINNVSIIKVRPHIWFIHLTQGIPRYIL